MNKSMLLSAAMAGILGAGTLVFAQDKPAAPAKAPKKRAEKVHCYGVNKCAGKGQGAVPGMNDCAGKNSCKGKGGCGVPVTHMELKAKDKAACSGKNGCKSL